MKPILTILKKYATPQVLLIVAALIIGFVFARSCNPAPDHSEGKAQVDSTADAVAREHVQFIHYVDSTMIETLAKDSLIRAQSARIDSLQFLAGVNGLRADNFAYLYKHSRSVHDTITALADCDSLADNYARYRIATVERINATDSVRTELEQENRGLKAALARAVSQANMNAEATRMMRRQYDELFKDYKRHTNWWHRWGKDAAVAVAVYIISSQLKK